MISEPLRIRRGQYVRTYFDTGALGPAVLYGIVTAAGPRAFTVRWESGLTNRVRQDAAGGLTRIPKADLDTAALERLDVTGTDSRPAARGPIMTTDPARHPHVTIEKTWDDNERVREARDGRVYVSTAGRWQWTVSVDDVVDSTHDRRRDAIDRRIAITTREAREARERLELEAAENAELKPLVVPAPAVTPAAFPLTRFTPGMLPLDWKQRQAAREPGEEG